MGQITVAFLSQLNLFLLPVETQWSFKLDFFFSMALWSEFLIDFVKKIGKIKSLEHQCINILKTKEV